MPFQRNVWFYELILRLIHLCFSYIFYISFSDFLPKYLLQCKVSCSVVCRLKCCIIYYKVIILNSIWMKNLTELIFLVITFHNAFVFFPTYNLNILYFSPTACRQDGSRRQICHTEHQRPGHGHAADQLHQVYDIGVGRSTNCSTKGKLGGLKKDLRAHITINISYACA